MKVRNPKITIGIPVYNGEDFLAETIASILKQTHEDFSLVISDNCSTDSTGDICREFERGDNRVRYQRNPRNVGASENYNRLCREASSPYFKWAAADDVLEPDFLSRCLEALEADRTVVLAYPQTTFIDPNDVVLDINDLGWNLSDESAAKRMAFVIQSGHWCNAMFALMRRDALAQTHLIGDYPGGDFRLLGEMALLGKFREIPQKLFRRRLHSMSSSQNPSMGWQLTFYTPHRRLRFCVPTVVRQLDHLRAVVQSDLSLSDKLLLTKLVGQQIRWRRSHIYREVQAILGQLWYRFRTSPAGELTQQHK